MSDTVPAHRRAIEDDVLAALDRCSADVPLQQPVDLLEFYYRMVDVIAGEGNAQTACHAR